ncbi:MAG: M28 family peptidase [Algicola sp.]|nr:M28 family peptidase [Algicola sp.]
MYQQVIKKIGLGITLSLAFTSVWANTLNETQLKEINGLKNAALNSTLAYEIDESLTTEVGARMIGSKGDKLAIKWAQAKMKSLGFDKVWTEDVTYITWERGMAEARILAPYPQKMVVLALGGSVGTGEQGIKALVVHFESLNDLQNAKAGSLDGKIAFISKRMTREIDGSGYGPAVGGRGAGAVVAAEKGAIGFILRSIGSDNNRVGHTGMMRYKEGVKKIPAAALSNPDADLLVNQFKRGKPVEVYLKLTSQRKDDVAVTSANVIGEITGSENPEEFVVLGAHLDSWDVGTGALDDGIGVSVTMAAASLIAKLPQRPKRSIRVILFAGEEVGLVGANQYMEKNSKNLDKHVIGVEWDFANGRIYDMRPGVGPQSLNNIRDLAKLIAPMGVSLNPQNNGRGSSDIRPLVSAGMPAMNFSANGLDYFDYHHTENDTLDKVDQEALPQITAVYAMFAYFAAQSGVDFRK